MNLLFIANWKMHKTIGEATAYAHRLAALSADLAGADLVLAPPFTALEAVARALRGTQVAVAGQDLYYEPQGAFTGEISAAMLLDAGCRLVIIGHSERRRWFGATDQDTAKCVRAALSSGLTPILCVGETLEEREGGQTQAVVERQLGAVLSGLKIGASDRMVVAYEPVWAIGTGRNATPEQAVAVHRTVRRLLVEELREAGRSVRILYGGSVSPENIGDLTAAPEIEGALVGGASLEVERFIELVRRGVAPRQRRER
jgi:triosephosphate isomerase